MFARLVLLVAPLSMLIGAAAFILSTVYLALERCNSGCTGFLEGMNRTPSLSTSGAIVAGGVLLLVFAGRWGRGIAAGFVAAFIATAASTSGGILFLWGIPTSPTVSPADARQKQAVARIYELQKQGLDERVGGALIYRVLDCLAQAQPPVVPQITSGGCADLRVSWEGYAGPERFGPADQGWRWSYSKYGRGYRVAVYPDAMLNRSKPQFASDDTGLTTVTRGVDPPVEFARPR